MVRRKKKEIAIYVVAAVILALSFWPWNIGATSQATFHERMLYPFFHANIFHAVCNLWCLIAMERYYDISPWKYLMAYLIAVSVPSVVLTAQPTVGMSGVCFALMGMITWEVARKLYWTAWIMAFLVTGFLFPHVNAWLHLYCYLAGLLIGILNAPIINVKSYR